MTQSTCVQFGRRCASPRSAGCAAVAAVLAAACTAALASTGFAQAARSPLSDARFLVIPFDNPVHEGRTYWLSEAAAFLLADNLTALGLSALTREERLYAFEKLQVPPFARLTRATMIRLGQIVGATHVVIGSVRLNGNEMTLSAQNIRLDTGRLEPEIVEAGSLDNLFHLFDRMSRRIASVPANGAAPVVRPSLPAFEHYIKSLLATAVSLKVSYLQSALQLDPGFDRARLALWSVHHDQGNPQAALVAAAGVPEASAFYARARFCVALSLIHLRRWDDGFATLTKIAGRSPSAPVLNNLGVIQLRRPPTPDVRRATHYFGEAVKLDQSDPDYYFNLGYAYLSEKDPRSAIQWLREAVRRDPADAEARTILAAAQQAAAAASEAGRDQFPRGLERLKERP